MLGSRPRRRRADAGRDARSAGDGDTALRLAREMLAAVPYPIVLVRVSDGQILYANDALHRVLDYAPGELAGRPVSTVAAPSRNAPRDRAAEILATLEHERDWTGELEMVGKQGTHVWSTARIKRIDDAEEGTALLVTQGDLRLTRHPDDALRRSEERFRGVFEQLPVAVALVADGRRVVDVNAAFCTLAGYARRELVGKAFDHVLHPDDAALDVELGAQLHAGTVDRYDRAIRLLTRAGDSVPVDLAATVVSDPDGSRLYCLTVVERRSGHPGPQVQAPPD